MKIGMESESGDFRRWYHRLSYLVNFIEECYFLCFVRLDQRFLLSFLFHHLSFAFFDKFLRIIGFQFSHTPIQFRFVSYGFLRAEPFAIFDILSNLTDFQVFLLPAAKIRRDAFTTFTSRPTSDVDQ